MENIERRVAEEIRALGRKLTGLAVPFNQPARILDFEERVLPGAFSACLAKGPDVACLADHDPSKLLGRTRSKTLRLAETPAGLGFEVDLPQTTLGADLLALAERGDLAGMSIGFRVNPGGERWNGKRRDLTSLELAEISVISGGEPAYKTSVQARSKAPVRLALAIRRMEII